MEELFLKAPELLEAHLQPILFFCFGSLITFIICYLRHTAVDRSYRDLKIHAALLEQQITLSAGYAEQKQEEMAALMAQVNLQFKDLSQQVFAQNAQTFSEQNSEKLNLILAPLKEQVNAFRERIDSIHSEETRERSSLKQQIMLLRELNQQISEEAATLSKALTTDIKSQGNWGELVLAKLLELSGLRKGIEFDTQKGFRGADHRCYKPDVIVQLPQNKQIIIDSKVSLSAWTRYVSAEDDAARDRALSEHQRAIRNHLKELRDKDYAALPDLHTLEFVLMFMPVDGAFVRALQSDEKLLAEMYAANIIIVTPTTLLSTLKVIESSWQAERQDKNVEEIADRARLLYDKLRGFLEDMDHLGKQLQSCHDRYHTAMNKLRTGRGNLLSQAAHFQELGVKIKRKIPGAITRATPAEPPGQN